MNSIKIMGTGMYVPEFIVNNNDFSKIVETSDEWIRTRTGMWERHISKDEPTWYLGAKAAEMAIENAGIGKNEIDLIIVTSVSPDYRTPSISCLIQHYIGIEDTMSLDINVACTGYPFGLDTARRYLATGDVEKVLFVNAESLSQMTNYEDRTSCVLFGDGAGACVISKADGIYGSYQNTDASGVEHLYSRITRKELPFFDSCDSSKYDMFEEEFQEAMYMNGKEVYKFATKAMPKAVQEACRKAGIDVSELDAIVPHQANMRIIETAVKNLNLDMDKFIVNIEKYGNTSSASAAMAMHEAVVDGRIKRGDKVCAVGFGAGLTYGATVFEY